jgi:hypothetical protein
MKTWQDEEVLGFLGGVAAPFARSVSPPEELLVTIPKNLLSSAYAPQNVTKSDGYEARIIPCGF